MCAFLSKPYRWPTRRRFSRSNRTCPPASPPPSSPHGMIATLESGWRMELLGPSLLVYSLLSSGLRGCHGRPPARCRRGLWFLSDTPPPLSAGTRSTPPRDGAFKDGHEDGRGKSFVLGVFFLFYFLPRIRPIMTTAWLFCFVLFILERDGRFWTSLPFQMFKFTSAWDHAEHVVFEK